MIKMIGEGEAANPDGERVLYYAPNTCARTRLK